MSFLSALKNSNYKVMICYNLVFNFKIFCHNYGSILSLLCFIAYVLFMLYYAYKDISPLKVEISRLIFDEMEKITQLQKDEIPKLQKEKIEFKEKTKRKRKSKIKGQYPPKKAKTKKIRKTMNDGFVKNTENNELVTVEKDNKKKRKNSFRKSAKRLIKKPEIYNKNEYQISDIPKEELDFNTENENKNFDNFELNNLDYDKACELDERGCCKTYWSVLMREHIILVTFFAGYDYNLFYVKMERFFVLICTQFTMNGLFFIHESMHRKYVQGEDLTFVEKIPQLLFTLIVSHIIEVILCCLSMTDTPIYEIKALSKKQNSGEKIIDIIDCMKSKLTIFFIFTFFLFLFYWYFISAFCAVYQNTQVIFLRDSGLSILTSFLDPFIIYGITTFLRIISLSVCFKKKLGCIYKLSDTIPIF